VTDEFTIRTRSAARESRIRVAPGGLERAGTFARRLTRARRAALVTDAAVASRHAPVLLKSLEHSGFACTTIVIPRGERAKRPAVLARLWSELAAAGVRRDDLVVALGGGVTGDVAGFAAATWLRGVDWICVPTTLLAQVDSSVGGKTAIDLPAGKNLAGAFHQPIGVLVDPATLRTLPVRQRRAGMAEVVKTGMAVDAALFAWLERASDALAAGETDALAGAIARSLRAKARVVARDERDAGPRTALNFGHTLGHAIEAAGGYRGPLHGEAVAVGMRVATALSVEVAGLKARDRARCEALLDRFSLPRRMPKTPVTLLYEHMERDKKADARGVRWVLPPRVGHASVPRLIPRRLVRAALLEAGACE